MHVSQADGRLLFQDVQTPGLPAGDRKCDYTNHSLVPPEYWLLERAQMLVEPEGVQIMSSAIGRQS